LRIDTVLFDLDGTLINTIPLIRWTLKNVFAHLNIPWREQEVMRTVGLPLRQIAARYAPQQVEDFVHLYTTIQKTRHRELTRAYPGTLETLKIVRSGGRRTGVVTSKRRHPALEGMAFTGIDRYIEVTVAADDVVKSKPHPEPLFTALQLLGGRPEKTVYVGDSEYDITAGKQAGVITVAVTWGVAPREQLAAHAPDVIVDSWDEFLDILGLPEQSSAGASPGGSRRET